jgi:hypothetical protein
MQITEKLDELITRLDWQSRIESDDVEILQHVLRDFKIALRDQARYQYLRRTTKAVHMDDGSGCINPTEAEFDQAVDIGIARYEATN